MAAYTSSLRPHTRGALLQELKELKAAYTTEGLELKGALAEAGGQVARLEDRGPVTLQACLRYDSLFKSMPSYVPK